MSLQQQNKNKIINLNSSDIVQNKEGFFYGLMPLVNQAFPICVDPDQIILQQTPNQNLFKQLNLPVNCSFQQYTQALAKYRTQLQLYGDQQQKSIIQNDSLEFKQLLHPQSKYLQKARHSFLVNISIPGTIQCQDPRNFMELRPVQQFRHTPLVPISQAYMKKHQQMLQRHHRKQFVFQLSNESIMNWALIGCCVSVASYMIWMIIKKQQQRTVNFSRMKVQRIMGQQSQKPIFVI